MSYYTVTLDNCILKVCGLVDASNTLITPDDTCMDITISSVDNYVLTLSNKCGTTSNTLYICEDPPSSIPAAFTYVFDGSVFDHANVTIGQPTIPAGFTLTSATYQANGNTSVISSFPYISEDIVDSNTTLTLTFTDTNCGDRTVTYVHNESINAYSLPSNRTVNIATTYTRAYTLDAEGCILLDYTDFGGSVAVFPDGVYEIQVLMNYVDTGTSKQYTTISGHAVFCDTCTVFTHIAQLIGEGHYSLATEIQMTYEALLASINCSYENSCLIFTRLQELIDYDPNCNC